MLPIAVAGVDHRTALDQRALFSFTKAETAETLERLRTLGIPAVLISTCNRTELWCESANARALISEAKSAPLSATFHTESWDAATHLFRVASGLESALLGEDQILGQVKDALAFAQELRASGSVLNQVFRCAISAAKEVKRDVTLQAVPVSAPSLAVERAKEAFGSLAGLDALVIGNGQMGRMAAGALLLAGARVRMTRRNMAAAHVYTHNQLPDVPGVTYIDYEMRYDAIESARVILSATASPHLILEADRLAALSRIDRFFVDLAVPRDIDPRIATLAGCRLIDIDDLATGPSEGELPAMAIWSKHAERLHTWIVNRGTLGNSIPQTPDQRVKLRAKRSAPVS